MGDSAAPRSGGPVVIGCAAGFWGDTETAAPQLLKGARLDYLVFDYLAEITMSIMAGARLKRPDGGHAHDFVTRVMDASLDDIMRQGVKIVTNAGGVNPLAARDALRVLCEARGYQPRIAIVAGDDLLGQHAELRQAGVCEMFDGRAMPASVLSVNAYLGARPIAAALAAGADFVITGRVVDSALVLGPLLHEFGWQMDDYDRLAQGSLAGHIVECGAQATGGIFTDFEAVGDYAHVGFPIIECHADGSFVLTKPPGESGLVTPAVALEQLVYEIGDPRAYALPDVTADFSDVQAEQVGVDRVRMRGARGRPPPARYKVSATYMDGFKSAAAFLLAGERAADKGRRVARALLEKTRALLAERGFADFSGTEVDVLGAESTYGPHARAFAAREVVVRIAVAHESAEAIKLMLRELPQAGTGMAPGLTGSVAGRPAPSPMIRLFSCLVERERIEITVDLDGVVTAVEDTPVATWDPAELPPPCFDSPALIVQERERRVPLIELAHGRSGDKGDHCNIGILARRPEYLPVITGYLTEERVADHMAHVLDPEHGRVRRFPLPGAHGLNFLLEHSLGGGGIASLRADPQGKAFAQQLLAIEVPVPVGLLSERAPDPNTRSKES